MAVVQTEYKSGYDPTPTDKSICFVVDCGQSSNFENIEKEIVKAVEGVLSRHAGCKLSLSQIAETKKLSVSLRFL